MRSSGEIKWRGEMIFVSRALVGEPVAIEEADDGTWTVRYFDVGLGVIDRKTPKLRRPAASACGTGGPAQPQNPNKTVTDVTG